MVTTHHWYFLMKQSSMFSQVFLVLVILSPIIYPLIDNPYGIQKWSCMRSASTIFWTKEHALFPPFFGGGYWFHGDFTRFHGDFTRFHPISPGVHRVFRPKVVLHFPEAQLSSWSSLIFAAAAARLSAETDATAHQRRGRWRGRGLKAGGKWWENSGKLEAEWLRIE